MVPVRSSYNVQSSGGAETRKAIKDLALLVEDPRYYARAILGADLWGAQNRILASLATSRRVAVKACHASGKSHVAAAAALWWVTRYSDGIVITTAPTWTQVERVLWGEIHKALGRSLVSYPPAQQTSFKLSADNYAIGLSTNEGVRFQGFHGRVLVILDEAPGVRPDIWEAIEGIRAGGDVRVLALGNPTVASGPFYDAFTSQRDNWATHTIGAFDTPNLLHLDMSALLALSDEDLDANPRPYLTTRRWVREKGTEWGERHPLWAARVLGEFPAETDDSLMSLAWLEDASRRVIVPAAMDDIVAGVDVAGPGEDETAVYVRHGGQVLLHAEWTLPDARGAVADALHPWKGNPHFVVQVDSIGIGYHFGLHLRDLGFQVRLVNVSEAPRNTERFANAKAEYYWALRERAQGGALGGLSDERTIAQLAGLRYEHDARGRVKIESKDDARKRGVKSPDRAEALMLAFAPAGAPAVAPVALPQRSYWRR